MFVGLLGPAPGAARLSPALLGQSGLLWGCWAQAGLHHPLLSRALGLRGSLCFPLFVTSLLRYLIVCIYMDVYL